MREPLDEWAEDLLKCEGKPHQTSEKRNKHPKGFEPGVRFEPGKGTGEAVVAVSPGSDPEWQTHLEHFGFGGVAEFLEVIEVRAWESPGKEGPQKLHYIKARIRRNDEKGRVGDVNALCQEIAEKKYTMPPKSGDDTALVIPLADWQAGKGASGGHEALILKVMRTLDLIEAHAKQRTYGRLIIAGMGDLVESCSGFYAMQEFTVTLTHREQEKLVRRLLVKFVERLAPYFPSVLITSVPGNHGEWARKRGKAFTDWGDNMDVAVMEQAAEVLQSNPAFKHVSAVIPDREMSVTLDVFGTGVGFVHGHQATSPERIPKWWEGMMTNRHPIGDCDVLITGHWHHWRCVQQGPRVYMVCPSLDGDHPRKGVAPRDLRSGSEWWSHRGGSDAPAATMKLEVGRDCGPFGWKAPELIA